MAFWLCTSVAVVMLVAGGLVAGGFGGCNMVWWHFLQPSILHEIFDLHLFIKWVFDKQVKLYDRCCYKTNTLSWIVVCQCYCYFQKFWICYVVVDYIYCPYFVRRILFCVFACFNYCSNWIEPFRLTSLLAISQSALDLSHCYCKSIL